MLNLFYNSEDKTKLRKYRTGYIKQDDGTKIPFKFYKMDITDIADVSFITGIEMQSTTFMISTRNSYPFDVHTKIIIDNIQHTISSISKEEDENANGLLRKNLKPLVYLTLSR